MFELRFSTKLQIRCSAALRESDAYPEHFHTEKPMFTALLSFTISEPHAESSRDEELRRVIEILVPQTQIFAGNMVHTLKNQRI